MANFIRDSFPVRLPNGGGKRLRVEFCPEGAPVYALTNLKRQHVNKAVRTALWENGQGKKREESKEMATIPDICGFMPHTFWRRRRDRKAKPEARAA
ncbi:MAG: hypothetical protein KGM42_15410 [Hyphomicrobiales bacterium]|nr:hypothetical protein [Hyphomicrobiales bacterium]